MKSMKDIVTNNLQNDVVHALKKTIANCVVFHDGIFFISVMKKLSTNHHDPFVSMSQHGLVIDITQKVAINVTDWKMMMLKFLFVLKITLKATND